MNVTKHNRSIAVCFFFFLSNMLSIQPGYASGASTTGNTAALADGGSVSSFAHTAYRAPQITIIFMDESKSVVIGSDSASSTSTSSLPASQSVNYKLSSTVKIKIDHNNASGRLYLTSEQGMVEPSYVELDNGQWCGKITFPYVGMNNKLIARYNDGITSVVESSTVFNVVDATCGIPKDAKLVGNIVDSDHVPIDGALIRLLAGDKEVGSASTDKNGNYEFNNIFPGVFAIKIEKEGYENRVQKASVALASRRDITKNFVLNKINKSSLYKNFAFGTGVSNVGKQVPVLLVPGIMGSCSTEKQPFDWLYPRLPAVAPSWNSGELKLLDPLWTVGWHKITSALTNIGYIEDVTIFSVPYDWSLSIPEIADKYLVPWIEEAKHKSGSDKVDIIAHSMGGLVARAYIQSAAYKNDVRKLAMVGTPNQGANAVYYIWAGGDPITADEVAGNTGMFNPVAYFYTNTLSYLFADKFSSYDVCKFGTFRRYKPASCNRDMAYSISHSSAWSSGQLMPIYDRALVDKDKRVVPIEHEENSFLKALNSLQCLNPAGCLDPGGNRYNYERAQDLLTNDATAVQTKLFKGESQPTISSIYVSFVAKALERVSLYRDGAPVGDPENGMGDGTVLLASVNPFSDNILNYEQKVAQHSFLIKVFADDLIKFIVGDGVGNKSFGLMGLSSGFAVPSMPQKTLVVGVNGKAQPIIYKTDEVSGVKVLKTEYKIDAAGSMVKNPENGAYKILFGSPSRESYELSIAFYDERNNRLSVRRYLGYDDGANKNLTFMINDQSADDGFIIFDRSFDVPTDLEVKNVDGKISLSWQDEVGTKNGDIHHYEIYWKPGNLNSMQLLGKTENSTKTYSVEYGSKIVDGAVYAVRAILNSGGATLLSQEGFVIK